MLGAPGGDAHPDRANATRTEAGSASQRAVELSSMIDRVLNRERNEVRQDLRHACLDDDPRDSATSVPSGSRGRRTWMLEALTAERVRDHAQQLTACTDSCIGRNRTSYGS